MFRFVHIEFFKSLQTGWRISWRKIAFFTFSLDFSLVNFAEWQPMMTRPSLVGNFFSSRWSWGRICKQFMQQYVKKSINTNEPARWSLKVKPLDTLNQSKPKTNNKPNVRRYFVNCKLHLPSSNSGIASKREQLLKTDVRINSFRLEIFVSAANATCKSMHSTASSSNISELGIGAIADVTVLTCGTFRSLKKWKQWTEGTKQFWTRQGNIR